MDKIVPKLILNKRLGIIIGHPDGPQTDRTRLRDAVLLMQARLLVLEDLLIEVENKHGINPSSR